MESDSFRLSLGMCKVLFVPSKYGVCFPPVLWKSYNQILLAFKARFPGDPQSLCQVPGLGGLMGVQNLHNSGRTSLVLLVSSLWVTHPESSASHSVVSDSLPPHGL